MTPDSHPARGHATEAKSNHPRSTERSSVPCAQAPHEARGCATDSRSGQPWSSAALGAIATRRLRRRLFEISIGDTARAVVDRSGQSRSATR
jgi:hypothetical protein